MNGKKKKTPRFTGSGAAEKNEAQDALRVWMSDFVKWAEQVRLDIIRLEGATHLPKGDPGPPPEDPWD